MVSLRRRWDRLSLAARFALASAAILFVGGAGIGAWVTREIETSVIRRVAADSALYVEALVGPHVQSLAAATVLSEPQRRALADALDRAGIARRVVSIKVWSPDGTIAYATDPHLIGTRPSSTGLARALAGEVVSARSDLRGEENAYERALADELVETYIPLRQASTERIIAVAEFYQRPDLLEAELERARLATWAVIGAATLAMYALLAGIVRAGSDTIERQRRALEATIAQLSAATARLRDLSAARVETDEAILRRLARELHDGLAQDLAAALLSLERGRAGSPAALARAGIESALAEVRALARGLALPDLAPLPLDAVLEHACAECERKTGMRIRRDIAPLPVDGGATLKLSLYRVLQEALSNAIRHAPGAAVSVRASAANGSLMLECADDGPGLPRDHGEGLGLRSMRERIELLGGRFEATATSGRGTVIRCEIPILR